MSIHVSESDLGEMAVIFFCALIGVFLVLLVIRGFVGMLDSGEELVTRKVKIIEKPVQQGNIEWYVVECDNGERLRLRNLHAMSVIISVGDEGFISFRGKTVESFWREEK